MSAQPTGTEGRAAVEAAIPHRDPFLFVDRILERNEDGLVSAWRVPEDAAWFQGHYPGEPVQPGVLLCEHVFQTAAVFVSESMGGFEAADGVPVLTKIENTRFRRVVRPGESLETSVRLEERLGPAWVFSGRVTCAGALVLRTRFVLSATAAMRRAFGDGDA